MWQQFSTETVVFTKFFSGLLIWCTQYRRVLLVHWKARRSRSCSSSELLICLENLQNTITDRNYYWETPPIKTISTLDRSRKYRFVCDVALSLTAEKIARSLTAASDRVQCGQTFLDLTERNANHIIPSYCNLPVSSRSLVDLFVFLGSFIPQIYLFIYLF